MWGTEDLVGVSKRQNTVASVGKLDISAQEFFSFILGKPRKLESYWVRL